MRAQTTLAFPSTCASVGNRTVIRLPSPGELAMSALRCRAQSPMPNPLQPVAIAWRVDVKPATPVADLDVNVLRLLRQFDAYSLRIGARVFLAGTEIEVVAEPRLARLPSSSPGKRCRSYLFDIRTRGGDGLTVLGRIKLDRPELPVLLFSAFDNPASIAQAAALGASGLLLKDYGRGELLSTIRTAATGKGTGATKISVA